MNHTVEEGLKSHGVEKVNTRRTTLCLECYSLDHASGLCIVKIVQYERGPIIMKRELLNRPRTMQLVADLRSEGVKIALSSNKIIGFVDGERVFEARKANFGLVCLLSDRILLDKATASAYVLT